MPRLKTSTPKKATDEHRAALTWNLGDSNSPLAQNVSVDVISDDEDATLYKPKRRHKKAKQSNIVERPLQLLLNKCNFYLTLKQEESEPCVCVLGNFSVVIDETFCSPELLERPEFWLYVSKVPTQSVLYFEWRECMDSSSSSSSSLRVKYFLVTLLDSYGMLSELQAKPFSLCPRKYDADSRMLHVDILLRDVGLTRLNYASEATRTSPNTGIQRMMQAFYGIKLPDYSGIKRNAKHDIDVLYAAIKAVHNHTKDDRPILKVQHPSLVPKLRPYQADAVRWMLQQEKIEHKLQNPQDIEILHELYEELKTSDGKVLYYNKYGGYLVQDKPLKVPRYPGGILADEMGLGKTVEVLACILCHPRCLTKEDALDTSWSSLEDSGFVSDSCPQDNSCNLLNSSMDPSQESSEEVPSLPSTATVQNIIQSLENGESDSCQVDINSSNKMEFPASDTTEPDRVADPSLMTTCSELTICNTGNKSVLQDSPAASDVVSSESSSTVAVQDIIGSLENGEDSSSQHDSFVVEKNVSAEDTTAVNGGEVVDRNFTIGASDKCNTPSMSPTKSSSFPDSPESSNLAASQNRSTAVVQDIIKSLEDMESASHQHSLSTHNVVDIVTADSSVGGDNLYQAAMFSDGDAFQESTETPTLSSSQSSSTAAVQDIINSLENMEDSTLQFGLNVVNKVGHIASKSSIFVNGTEVMEKGDIIETDEINVSSSSVNSAVKHVKLSLCTTDVDLANPLVVNSELETSEVKCKEEFSLPKNAPKVILNGELSHEFSPRNDVPEQTKTAIDKNGMENDSENLIVRPDAISFKSTQKRSLESDKLTQNFNSKSKKSRVTWVVESAKEFAQESVVPKAFFECICGAVDNIKDRRERIQCNNCCLWQHMDCVKYDLSMGPFYCPHCWVARPPVCSRATLIVSPAIIQCQWVDEIQRHLRQKALKILVYAGVHKHGFIQPHALSSYDIVLTSYETLRKEIDYVDLPHSNSEAGRRFRHPKRFMAIPSPLVAVEWWRICLDEAQMVECTSTKTAEMALRLRAANRWCVTGTPIQKGLADLYGLLLFLGADPYWVKAWWRDCLFEPYCHGITEPMHDVISQYLWRSAKSDVIDQINIPQQTEEVHWLSFSPVEEHFYRQQHLECSHDAVSHLNKVLDLDAKLSSLDRHTLSRILFPLLRLRQACCHPQAVRGQFMSVHKSTMTMDELLKSLIKKTKIEAEEAHRQHIASVNGLASLHVIKEEWVDAIEGYREVLRLADEHSQHIKTDKLQRLHALHNLAELLDAGHTNIPPTMRDSTLKAEAEELRSAYLTKCAAKVANSQESLNAAQRLLRELRSNFSCSFPWWASVLDISLGCGKAEDLVFRVKNDLTETSGSHKRVSVANRFTDIRGLKFVLTTFFDDLQASHTNLAKAVLALNPQPSQEDLNAAVECHLRPTERRPPMCTYCKVHELFNKYETKLYSFRDEDERYVAEPSTKDDAMMLGLRKGTWADSELETMVKTVLNYAKSHNWNGIEVDDGNIHIKMFEAMKKEFRALRGVWMQIRDQVSAVDELGMATIRLRLRLEDEPKPDTPQPNILERSEIDHHRLKLMSDCIVATNERRKKLGQLWYLQNLAKSDVGKKGGSNPEPCPICQRTLGEQWSVLQCGHCFCIECIRVLTTQFSSRGRCRSLKCPICRQMTAPGEMSYVNTKGEDIEEETLQVLGSHSTKVEAIVRTLMQIQQKEPSAKALVFSTWQDVLDVLATALTENNITFRSLSSHAKLQASLSSFKKDPDVAVLLLPVHSGANGLNLIEATHVLLVEPVLNLASEHQAIGRVHRIGQSKPTVVHRFLVRGTIEERMDAMLKSHIPVATSSHESEENVLTLRDLRNLFAEENALTQDNDDNLDDDVGVAATE